ncbi:glycoprotein 3-alpha-L-fucosyltransferase A-like [Ylistrum balloti]|uniref:glycoprotein 3-alpha-L-fucosyltransferase A-like n=1 Tax=Ylistrum balloti TaxID=509963 RepID=UPI002905DBD5|nr:glycoprotein 3-alpha-L-fucosyltransferase A-like [Ylistrum balloti]
MLVFNVIVLKSEVMFPYFDKPDQPMFQEKVSPKEINVLYFNKPEWVHESVFNNCEYPCKMISGSKLDSANFVVFHGPRIGKTKPPNKLRGQVWIMHGMESPHHYNNDLTEWSNLFNWTFTYRRDSDVLSLYSGFQFHRNNTTTNIRKQWKAKDRNTAWMVSNCHTPSKRMQYMKSLKSSTDIHVYGGCGHYRCARSNENNCMELLQKHYRYYLAFENSLCVDYITEKAFKTYTASPSTVSVVRGGSNYSLFLPPGSYLDAKDFENGHALGEAMKRSFDNASDFFSWTKYYTINPNVMSTWCSLCKHIHHSENYKRIYSNIKFWLKDLPRSGCKTPK